MNINDDESLRVDDKPWIVQKFGGTSIGKYPLNVVENVIKPATNFCNVVVVCSALSTSSKNGGTTNRLLQAYRHWLSSDLEQAKTIIKGIRTEHIDSAYAYIKTPQLVMGLVEGIERECGQVIRLLQSNYRTALLMDKVIGTGERLACIFLCALLQDRRVAAQLVDLSEIVPTSLYNSVDQSFLDGTSAIMAKRIRLCQSKVAVVTGFFGPIEGGLIHQVGRGYTDFCASMISVGLGAQELQIWKEVEGIFTANPSKVPSAKMIPIISSEEASELTFHGSEVIHYEAMRLAMRERISMRIKNVLNPRALGTLVLDDWSKETPVLTPLVCMDGGYPRYDSILYSYAGVPGTPTAVTSKDGILLINIRSTQRLKAHRFLAGVFTVLDGCNLSFDLVCTSDTQVSMALHSHVARLSGQDEDESELARRQEFGSAIHQLQKHGDVEILYKRTIISLVGRQLARALTATGRMFSILNDNHINIEMIAHGASAISISCVVQEQDAGRAVALLHAAFFTNFSSNVPVPRYKVVTETIDAIE